MNKPKETPNVMAAVAPVLLLIDGLAPSLSLVSSIV